MSIRLLLAAVAVVALSGVPGLFLSRRSALGQWVAALMNIVGSIIGGIGLIIHFARDEGPLQLAWARNRLAGKPWSGNCRSKRCCWNRARFFHRE